MAASAVTVLVAGGGIYMAFAGGSEPGIAEVSALVEQEFSETNWRLVDVNITETQRANRNNTDFVVHEFAADIAAIEARYLMGTIEWGFVFATPYAQPGQAVRIEGEAVFARTDDDWQGQARLIGQTGGLHGGLTLEQVQRASQSRGTVVVEGTPEAEAAREEIARQEAALAQRIAGDWISRGRCGRIQIESRIRFDPGSAANRFTGEMTYRPIYPDPPFEFGSLTLTAIFFPGNTQGEGRLEAQHNRWIERPDGNVSIFIRLAADGDEFTGTSNGLLGNLSRGDCTYRFQRPEAFEAERAELMAPVRAVLDRIETGVALTGSQVGPTRADQTDWPVQVTVTRVEDEMLLGTMRLTAFNNNNNRILGDMDVPFGLIFGEGVENVQLEFGPRPRMSGPVRNLYSGGNCRGFQASLDPETGVVTAGHGSDIRHCIDALRIPLVP